MIGVPFTKETASLAGKKGAESRWRRPSEPVTQTESAEIAENAGLMAQEVFRAEAVACARTHIRRLQARIDDELDRRELDTKAMRELADTIKALEVVEQKLSNRPAPAAQKVTDRKPRRQAEVAPEPSPE